MKNNQTKPKDGNTAIVNAYSDVPVQPSLTMSSTGSGAGSNLGSTLSSDYGAVPVPSDYSDLPSTPSAHLTAYGVLNTSTNNNHNEYEIGNM